MKNEMKYSIAKNDNIVYRRLVKKNQNQPKTYFYYHGESPLNLKKKNVLIHLIYFVFRVIFLILSFYNGKFCDFSI